MTLRKWPFGNIVGKGENAVNQHFLLLPQCFAPFPNQISIFHFHLSCLLPIIWIWTSLWFCHLVKSKAICIVYCAKMGLYLVNHYISNKKFWKKSSDIHKAFLNVAKNETEASFLHTATGSTATIREENTNICTGVQPGLDHAPTSPRPIKLSPEKKAHNIEST